MQSKHLLLSFRECALSPWLNIVMPCRIILAEGSLQPNINTPAGISYSRPAKKARASPPAPGNGARNLVRCCMATAKAQNTLPAAEPVPGTAGRARRGTKAMRPIPPGSLHAWPCQPAGSLSVRFKAILWQSEQSFFMRRGCG